ncbi:PAS domain-containing protein [Dyella jejuensis]|uniref:PAS domain-containing protein n=1 Tax=Dyella jejuensis TaxID=1432009 RepID=A0ABW8JE99_9GAMM
MIKSETFLIVGIGASAGGIEALEGFFRGVSAEAGLAFAIVTHLPPDRESLLHEIVARHTSLTVHVATDGVKIEADNIYVLPANAVLSVKQGHLHLREKCYRERKPIDIFFSSLAVDAGERSIGVILSGGDSDGTLGLKAIKEHGGMTMAQVADGFGPQHPDMPESAIVAGFVDFALPAEKMGEKLAELARLTISPDSSEAENTASAIGQAFQDALPDIYALLRNQVGHDFSGYKKKTFIRRVQRRMHVKQLPSVKDYMEVLRQEPHELAALFRDLLINVTNFFRDGEAFEALASQVIPKLFEARGANDTVRIWVPGCATGEEVYTLGILVREYLATQSAVPRVQIFATDIDERALAVARAACYPATLLESVSPERRRRFFNAEGDSFIVNKEVRELCMFSPHSVIRDPPFSRMDLISCRNLLIYLGPDVQGQVIPTFHYALRPDGYLFLGSAENVSQFDELFAAIDKRHRIFRRRSDIATNLRLPAALSPLRSGSVAELIPRRVTLSGMALRQAVDQHVLERFAPPHVLVNRDGDVVYFSSRTGKYLEAPAGAPTRQLLTMTRRDLRLDLHAVFRETVESGKPATREGVAIEIEDGRIQIIRLSVEPLHDRGMREPLFLVLFIDQGPLLSREEALDQSYARQSGPALHLEHELRDTRDRLQSMIEEYETALEELKSSNEELVSVNEEMQSTNEELEASKEELQSVNEELQTVNTELNGKVEALDRANSDLLNLFESTNVATVFLDHSLAIRSFTPAVNRIFNILPGDRGRPITDLASHLNLARFMDDIHAALQSGVTVEKHVENDNHTAHYLVRLAPYEDSQRKIEGVVVTFLDVTTITSITRSGERQKLLIAELQHRTRNLLALVQSIAYKTLGKHDALPDFYARLAALSRAQSLLGGSLDESIDLRDVVRLELEALNTGEGKISVSGPSVALRFDSVQVFCLALHELATNAVKYGALKNADGHLDISWTVQDDADKGAILVLRWLESGVAIHKQPTRQGFGRELLEKALAFTLRARTELTFGADGVTCYVEIPLPALSSIQLARKDATA